MPIGSYPHPHAALQQLQNRVSTYLLRSYPIRDLPLNIRPAIVFLTATWLLLLGILGMAPLPELPVNDKALHFFGLGFATFLLYYVIEVPEGPARRVWYIRRAPLLLTLILSFFFGGIVSEFVQSLLPWKQFQLGDVIANLLGSTLFLYLAHILHRRSRRRSERQALYQPLDSSTYRDAQGREHTFDSSLPHVDTSRGTTVWDEDESDNDPPGDIDRISNESQVFEIGDDEPRLREEV